MLSHTDDVYAQKIYSLGGASILQTIDINDYKVVDRTTLIPSMTDIAFHSNGTLYGVSANNIYKIDTTDGSSVIIKQLPAAYGWLVGLTIDYDGVFFLSALGGGQDFIIRYDPSNDVVVNLGSTGWRHWDLEFYNGQLYLSGGTLNTSEGFLIQANLADPSQSKVIVDFGAQAFGMSSFNDICGGNNLVVATTKNLIRLDPEGASFSSAAIDNPLYTFSSGATSLTSYLGSLPPLKINMVEVESALCDITATASVEIVIAPGRAGVEYSLDGINYQDSPNFTNVSIGMHQAYIRDGSGCSDMSDPFEIKLATIDFTTQSQPAHCGEENGVITPSAMFAGDSLEFSINGIMFYEDPEFNNLSGGNYIIYVRNKSGCTDSVEVVVEELPILKHQSNTTPEHCDLEDGTITVLATGGLEPYSYTLVALPPQSDPIFTGLHASNFLVRVTDVLGCASEELTAVDLAPSPIVEDIIIQEAHCDMPDGSAEIIALSSSGSLEYSINSGPFTSNALFMNLEPGLYVLNVLDEFGCDTTTTFVIPAKDGPVIQNIIVKNDYCNSSAGRIEIDAIASAGNLMYSLNNGSFTSESTFTGLTKGVYLLTVRDSFGCDAIENVLVDEEAYPKIEAIETVDATCNESNGSISVTQSTSDGAEYSLNNIDFQIQAVFSDLSPGNFTVYLIDNNGCIDSVLTSLANTEQTIISDIIATDESCQGHDGVLTIIASTVIGDIQYSIDGSNFQGNEIFENLVGNNYTGYLIDGNGCIDSMQIIIQAKERIILNKITVTPANCGESDGTITVLTEGEVEITLNSENAFSSELISGLEEGTYLINLVNESECSLDTIIEVTGTSCNIFIPNAFSPNGDGVNETLFPFFDPALFQLLQFQIFDRWGNNVFKCDNLCEWDGYSFGEPSPAGVYVYLLQVQDENGTVSEMSGDVTLMR
jgi:gliding motility-associated-like protein